MLSVLGWMMIGMTAVFIVMSVKKIVPTGRRGIVVSLEAIAAAATGLALTVTMAPAMTAAGFMVPVSTAGLAGRHASFTDTFTGKAGASPGDRWIFDTGDFQKHYRTHEIETYSAARAYSHLDGHGHLVITATKSHGQWTSARLTTRANFYRGTFAARIKFPDIHGMWPAFWLLGPRKGEEVDIAELYGNGIWPYGNATVHAVRYRVSTKPIRPLTAWHTFRLTWTPGRFTFYMDGRSYGTITKSQFPNWPYSSGHGMHIILNLAIGGLPGGTPAPSVKKMTMLVDSVRVRGAKR